LGKTGFAVTSGSEGTAFRIPLHGGAGIGIDRGLLQNQLVKLDHVSRERGRAVATTRIGGFRASKRL
jgi:hypothetical protein